MHRIVRQKFTVTIAGGATTSGIINLDDDAGAVLLAVQTDAAFAGTGLSLEASADGTNFVAVRDEYGGTYTPVAAASRLIPIRYQVAIGLPRVRVVSNAAQGGGTPTTLTLVVGYPS